MGDGQFLHEALGLDLAEAGERLEEGLDLVQPLHIGLGGGVKLDQAEGAVAVQDLARTAQD